MHDWTLEPCVDWWGYVSEKGYGRVYRDGRHEMAHRMIYQETMGAIPAGLTIDHLCRNRRCVNPAHMDPVTVQENLRRGNGASARNARKTHCVNGHPLSGNNLWIDKKRGYRVCRECKRAHFRAYRSRRIKDGTWHRT